MGRGDNRRSPKMRRRQGQEHKKARIKARAKVVRLEHKQKRA